MLNRDELELVAACEKRLSYMATYMALHDRFNYEIFSRMQKVADPGVGTAGVCPDGLKVKFLYSPAFISSLSIPELAYVVSHEVGHVVMHHFDRGLPTKPWERALYNAAADLAINSLFKPREGIKEVPALKEDIKLPDGTVLASKGSPSALLPSKFGLPDLLSLEHYYGLLLDKYRQAMEEQPGDEGDSPQKGSGKGQSGPGGDGDSGSDPEGGEGDPKKDSPADMGHASWKNDEIAKAIAKEWVDTVDRLEKWGDTPGSVKASVMAAQKASVRWDQLLREKYGQMTSTKRVSTYKRPSRRFGYPWCSKKTEPRDKKLVMIDTSGSISDRDLSRFKAETDRLAEEQVVEYMTFDTVLHMEEALPWDPGLEFRFKGRGGTDVGPALKYAAEHGYQDCIVLTDGYFEAPAVTTGVNVLWVITKGGSKRPANFGTVVMIDGH